MPLFSPISAGAPKKFVFGVIKHNSQRLGMPMGIGFDSSGNIYVGASHGIAEITVTKFNSTGTEIWSKRITGTSMYGNGFNVDSSGNSYITTNTNVSSTNRLIAIKLDTSGNTVWQKQWNPNVDSWASHLDSSGNLYCTGNTASGETAGYLIKLDTNGSRVLAVFRSTTGQYEGWRSVTSDSGQNFITGGDGGTATDGKLVRFYSNGTLHWNRATPGKVKGIATDSSNNIYYGSFVQETPGGGFGDVRRPVLVKLDVNANVQWTRKILTGVPLSGGPYTSVRVDSSNNIYFTCMVQTGSNNNSGGGDTILVNKYNASGGLIWSKSITSSQEFPGTASTGYLTGPTTTLDSSGDLYIGASYGYWDNSISNFRFTPFFVKMPSDGIGESAISLSGSDIAIVTNTSILEGAHTTSISAPTATYGSPGAAVSDATTLSNNASVVTTAATTF